HMQVPGHNELAIVNMNDIEKNEEIKNKFKEINDMYGKKSNFDTSICKQEYNKILDKIDQNHKEAFIMIINEINKKFDEYNRKNDNKNIKYDELSTKIDTIMSILISMKKQESCRMC